MCYNQGPHLEPWESNQGARQRVTPQWTIWAPSPASAAPPRTTSSSFPGSSQIADTIISREVKPEQSSSKGPQEQARQRQSSLEAHPLHLVPMCTAHTPRPCRKGAEGSSRTAQEPRSGVQGREASEFKSEKLPHSSLLGSLYTVQKSCDRSQSGPTLGF